MAVTGKNVKLTDFGVSSDFGQIDAKRCLLNPHHTHKISKQCTQPILPITAKRLSVLGAANIPMLCVLRNVLCEFNEIGRDAEISSLYVFAYNSQTVE